LNQSAKKLVLIVLQVFLLVWNLEKLTVVQSESCTAISARNI